MTTRSVTVPLLQTLTSVISAIGIAVSGWMLSVIGTMKDDIHRVDAKIIAVQEQQFTVKDSNSLNEKILDKINSIEIKVANAYTNPPQWLIDIVKAQTERIDKIENALRDLHGPH